MTLSRRARESIAILFLLAFAVLVLRANVRQPSELNWLDRGLLRLSAPVQSGLNRVARGAANLWKGYVYLVDVRKDNVSLAADNRRLAGELAKARLAESRAVKL